MAMPPEETGSASAINTKKAWLALELRRAGLCS